MANDTVSNGSESKKPAGSAFPLAVVTQYLKDFSFENPGGYNTVLNVKEMPTGNIRVDVRVESMAPPNVEVVLFLSLDAKIGEKTAYQIECEYAGLFRIGRMEPEQMLPLVLIEAPRLLFPFARQIIANAVQAGNFPPLLINPIDFAALYHERREELLKNQLTKSPEDSGTKSNLH